MNEGAGDWICSDQSCGNINFARRLSCYRCNKDRPDGGKMSKKKLGTEIGKSAAEKSRGLFNADDWQCNKCANVNWARRTTCNVCNAPKFGEVEARTGYGGGYNERGVVEYRRREPSSDDEYDEFGRKKRKRNSDAPNSVGITEGPLVKKMPPTMLDMELDMDAKEDPALNDSKQNNRDSDKVKGSLSDSSICDPPPLSNMAFRRNQLQNQTNYHRQNHMLPSYKRNGMYMRKRFASSTDHEFREPFINETPPKKLEHRFGNPSGPKCLNLSNENRSQLVKDNFVYKFTGATPSETYEVTYSIEERVKVAAFAIVHNNCKISTEKFEALYDKPAPDFKTIFAWRQRLLSTGCLVDTHIDSPPANNNKICLNKIQTNPDEIPISSDSDSEHKVDHFQSNSHQSTLVRSTSAETLVICNSQKISSNLASALEDPASQKQNHSSPHLRTRSSSRDTRDSNYPDSDSLERSGTNSINHKINTNNSIQNTQSIVVRDTESDTEVSYDSDYIDFLSRVYGEGKKPRHKPLKRQTSANSKVSSESNDLVKVQGYCTVKTSEQSPLASGNIYTSNVRNMQVKTNVNLTEVEGGSVEYVPTKLGSSTKKNYQDFKNNVKRKGFWAKGNCGKVKTIKQPIPDKTIKNHDGTSYENNIPVVYKNVSSIPLLNPIIDDGVPFTSSIFNSDNIIQIPVTETQGNDFTNDSLEKIHTDIYTSFDKSLQSNESTMQSSDDASRIFDVVQSNAVLKNRSIMEIFDVFDDHIKPDTNVSEHSATSKPYTLVWDEDDDALYKGDDTEVPNRNSKSPASSINESVKSQSAVDMQQSHSKNSPSKLSNNVFVESDALNLSKYQQNGTVSEITSKYIHNNTLTAAHIQDDSSSLVSQVIQPHFSGNDNLLYSNTPHNQIAQHIQTEEMYAEDKQLTCSQSKRIHIIESLTIMPNDNAEVVTQNCNNSQTSTITNMSPIKDTNENINSHESTHTPINISNILAGINTDTLLLAIKNLQQLAQKSEDTTANHSKEEGFNGGGEGGADKAPVETINLTNDEDWEKESDTEGSIERQLKRIHGSTGETPFLSDIFDPGPVVIPPNVAKKLNIIQNGDSHTPNKDNAPVIGNFKSFALPKPIMLNRLKLAIKQPVKDTKKSDGRPRKRKKKSKVSAGQGEEGKGAEAEEAGDEEEEESGDDADLSKYDLWGSDDDASAATETIEKKDGDAKEGGTDEADKNGEAAPVESKIKRRSRSSSSSSTSSSSSSSSRSSAEAPRNKFDDFNLNSERESSPGARRSRSPLARPAAAHARRKRDSRSAGDSRSHESSRDKDRSRERDRRAAREPRDGRERARSERRERRYSRDAARARHR